MQHIFSTISAFMPLVVLALVIKYRYLPMIIRDDFFSAKGEMKKISLTTPLLKRSGINVEDYYYDGSFLYQQRDGEVLCKIPLENIIRVEASGIRFNDRSVWLVRYLATPPAEMKECRFITNYTAFNRDFIGFMNAVRAANPAAEVQKMTFARV